MEKMKKELDVVKRAQKALLIDKNKLDSTNKTLQEEVVKGKIALANILNIVQDTGNEKLISEAYSLI